MSIRVKTFYDGLMNANYQLKKGRVSVWALGCVRVVFMLLGLTFATVHTVSAENAVINPSAADPVWLHQRMTLPDARHLLGRTGFGSTPEQLGEMLSLSRSEAVQQIIDGLRKTPDLPMPDWVNEPAPHFWARRALKQEQRQAFDRERDMEIVELRRWWVNNMLQTHSPQTERLVLFWHDHFATNYHGIARRSISMARQNQLFRERATGSYRELLKSIIRDPAMLRYLDNQSNRKGKPNENLAREFLELFTLGEGNFNEATVKAAAQALTGYGISETHNESFRFHDYKHDYSETNLFGRIAHNTGDDLVELVLQQSTAAEHLVKRFWHAYISDGVPSDSFVEQLASEFRQSDYDLLHLYKSMLRSEAFWHEEHRLALIKSPATLLIGTARTLDYPKQAWTQLPALHALLGMDLFAPPNVSGWTEGGAFVSPGKLLNRQLAIQSITNVSNPAPEDKPAMMMAVEESSASLNVRVAGHFFRGAPQYRVHLLNTDKQSIWSSEVRTLQVGHDTEMFGEMRSMDQLAWYNAAYTPSAELLAQSNWARVEFLNDAADKTGDRNLFVESVSVQGEHFSSAGAIQNSHCAPKNRRDAGNLYCAGHVTIDISGAVQKEDRHADAYTAGNASVLWANSKGQRLNAVIALEHVQTPNAYFHTLSFHLASEDANSLQIALDTYSCWPDCFKQWPECAIDDTASNLKRIVLPLKNDARKVVSCHYTSLSASDKALVNSIYQSLPVLLDFFAASDKTSRFSKVVKRWEKRINRMDGPLSKSSYSDSGQPFEISREHDNPSISRSRLPEPPVIMPNLQAVEQLLQKAGVSLAQILIGGLPVETFPELSLQAIKSDTTSNISKPAASIVTPAIDTPTLVTPKIEQQLQAILDHPVYQVY